MSIPLDRHPLTARPVSPAASTPGAAAQPSSRSAMNSRPMPHLQWSDDHGAREAAIAEAAYYRAEKRHFAPGGELQDWLAAEREIDGLPAAH